MFCSVRTALLGVIKQRELVIFLLMFWDYLSIWSWPWDQDQTNR